MGASSTTGDPRRAWRMGLFLVEVGAGCLLLAVVAALEASSSGGRATPASSVGAALGPVGAALLLAAAVVLGRTRRPRRRPPEADAFPVRRWEEDRRRWVRGSLAVEGSELVLRSPIALPALESIFRSWATLARAVPGSATPARLLVVAGVMILGLAVGGVFLARWGRPTRLLFDPLSLLSSIGLAILVGVVVATAVRAALRLESRLATPLAAVDRAEHDGEELLLYASPSGDPAERLRLEPRHRERLARLAGDRLRLVPAPPEVAGAEGESLPGASEAGRIRP